MSQTVSKLGLDATSALIFETEVIKNRYFGVRFWMMLTFLLKGKLSFRKLINVAHCYGAHKIRAGKSSPYPFMINLELWNECQAQCVFCRTKDGEIYDQDPSGKKKSFIPKGKMPLDMYEEIIEQAKNHLLCAVLYVNGEPLIYKDIYKALKFASERKVGTMISTNGELLTENNIQKLLDSGLDCLKVAISGFTQDTYEIQHRGCDFEKVKKNLETLSRLRRQGKYKIVILLDYIFYNYNRHQAEQAYKFSQDLGFLFNRRPGSLDHLKDDRPEIMKMEIARQPNQPATSLCEWPWKVMTIDWNGSIYPCCDYVLRSDAESYATFNTAESRIETIWNGQAAIRNRKIHASKGRKAIDICSTCPRTGTSFKY